MGWTSIYQLFWCSPGVQGFDTLPNKFKSPGLFQKKSVYAEKILNNQLKVREKPRADMAWQVYTWWGNNLILCNKIAIWMVYHGIWYTFQTQASHCCWYILSFHNITIKWLVYVGFSLWQINIDPENDQFWMETNLPTPICQGLC